MRWGLVVALLVCGCGTKAASQGACTQVTDEACCVNGVLSGAPCMRDGALVCLSGGFPCNEMGYPNSECAQKCVAPDTVGEVLTDVSSDLQVPDAGSDTSACNQAEKGNLCCCDTDLHIDLVCGADGQWTCPGYYHLYSGVDCAYASGHGPCTMPLVDVPNWRKPDATTFEE